MSSSDVRVIFVTPAMAKASVDSQSTAREAPRRRSVAQKMSDFSKTYGMSDERLRDVLWEKAKTAPIDHSKVIDLRRVGTTTISGNGHPFGDDIVEVIEEWAQSGIAYGRNFRVELRTERQR